MWQLGWTTPFDVEHMQELNELVYSLWRFYGLWLTLIYIIIHISYTVRIPIFRLVDLYHVALGYDETTSLTSLSWCNTRGVNSIHHCHYTMASADSNNKNVNTPIARELSGFNCTRSLTMNSKFSIPHFFSSIVSELVQVNPDNSFAECVNL